MNLSYTEWPGAPVVELVVKGRVTREDYEAIVEPLQAFIDCHGTVRVIEVIEDLDGFDAGVLLPGIRFDLKNMRNVSHVAVVSDIGWLSPVSRAAGALTPITVRSFPLAQMHEARKWIKNPDKALAET